MRKHTLNIYEIFESISGEIAGFPAGSRAIFIRLAGCNLNCAFCDAPMSRPKSQGNRMEVEQLIKQITYPGCPDKIIITGGEPLLQVDLPVLVAVLSQQGFSVSIETNGSINRRIPGATLIVDYKLNETEEKHMELNLFQTLAETDIIKFVVNQVTLKKAFAKQQVFMPFYKKNTMPTFAYSPMIPAGLTQHEQWHIMCNMSHKIMDGLSVRGLQGLINLQLHKVLDFQ